MLIFLDTEFTNLTDRKLISIGMVSEDGQHARYRKLRDFDLDCSYRNSLAKKIHPTLANLKHSAAADGATKRAIAVLGMRGALASAQRPHGDGIERGLAYSSTPSSAFICGPLQLAAGEPTLGAIWPVTADHERSNVAGLL